MNTSTPTPDQNKIESLTMGDSPTNNCLQSPSSSLSSTSTSTISSPNFNAQSNSSQNHSRSTNKSSEGNLQKLAINNSSNLNRASTPILTNAKQNSSPLTQSN